MVSLTTRSAPPAGFLWCRVDPLRPLSWKLLAAEPMCAFLKLPVPLASPADALVFCAPLLSLAVCPLLCFLFFLLGRSCRCSPHSDRSADLRRLTAPPGFRLSHPAGQLHLKVCGGHGSTPSNSVHLPLLLPTLLLRAAILVTGTTGHPAA